MAALLNLMVVVGLVPGYLMAKLRASANRDIEQSNYEKQIVCLKGKLDDAKAEQQRLLVEKEALLANISTANLLGQAPSSEALTPINSQTFGRLKRAIEAFPVRYPEYDSKPPKLDSDVRPWLQETEIALNEAEKRIFATIIAEHFGFR